MEPLITLVDSSVVIDLLERDPEWGEWSREAIARCAGDGVVAVNQIVYSEVAPAFDTTPDLDRALSPFERLSLPWEAAFAAARAFIEYLERGGARTSILPDFYIGAHAAVADLRLLTRDAARFRTYFPSVVLVAP